MQRTSIYIAAGFIGSLLLSALPASAAEFCDIKKMPDGFLALRAQPDASGRLVARMKVGDEVMINNTVAGKSGWTRVYWWKGGRAQGGKIRGLSQSNGQGWVNSKLLGDECG